jgi:type II secretory pathway pseudopilin PulG
MTLPHHIPQARARSRARRPAFTLLELLLACAVFASIATLGATLYLQATRLGAAPLRAERSLELQRVVTLARDQWDNRRAMALGDDAAERPEAASIAAQFAPGRVSFVTASPVLFPDWPLVSVTYSIEQTLTAAGEPRFTLVYAETRITDPSEPPDSAGNTPDGRRRSASIPLVGPCEALTLQRFGPETAPAPDDGAGDTGPAARSVRTSRTAAPTNTTNEPEPADWHVYDGPFDGPVYAVRFVGTLHGDRFTCTFLAEPSR